MGQPVGSDPAWRDRQSAPLNWDAPMLPSSPRWALHRGQTHYNTVTGAPGLLTIFLCPSEPSLPPELPQTRPVPTRHLAGKPRFSTTLRGDANPLGGFSRLANRGFIRRQRRLTVNTSAPPGWGRQVTA